MRVKIGNKVYNSEEEPIVVIFNKLDKDNIKSMGKKYTKYCCFPEEYPKEEIEKFVNDIPKSNPQIREDDYMIRFLEILNKFKNGKKLYQISPIFNATVNSLVRGADIYELMEQIIEYSEKTQEILTFHINHSNLTNFINRENK